MSARALCVGDYRESSHRGENLAPGKHFNDDTSNGPKVSDVVPAKAHHHLGRAVLTSADECVAVTVLGAPLCRAEVNEPNFSARRRPGFARCAAHEANVLWLDVSVDELEGVDVGEGLDRLPNDVTDCRERIRAKLVRLLKLVPVGSTSSHSNG